MVTAKDSTSAMGIARRFVAGIAGFGALGAGLTMLQIAQYGLAEILLVVSMVAFFLTIRQVSEKPVIRTIAGMFGIGINLYFGLVVYASKGDNSWLGVLSPRPQFSVTLKTVVISGAMNNTLLFVVNRPGKADSTISPINVYASAVIRNNSPFPIRLTAYRAYLRDTTPLFSSETKLVPIPLEGESVYFRGSNDKGFGAMAEIKSDFVPLDDSTQGQIEATRERSVVMAFEYPGAFQPSLLNQCEVTVFSDVAGYSIGVSDSLGETKESLVHEIGLTTWRVFPPVNLGNPKFIYFSDIPAIRKAVQ